MSLTPENFTNQLAEVVSVYLATKDTEGSIAQNFDRLVQTNEFPAETVEAAFIAAAVHLANGPRNMVIAGHTSYETFLHNSLISHRDRQNAQRALAEARPNDQQAWGDAISKAKDLIRAKIDLPHESKIEGPEDRTPVLAAFKA